MTIFDQAQAAWDEVHAMIQYQQVNNINGIKDINADWEIELFSCYALMADDIIMNSC